jgi:hypothetical protein
MVQSQSYRAYAEQCLALASKMTGDQRAYMLEMTRAWHQLAQDQEQIERLEKCLRETAAEQEPIPPSAPSVPRAATACQGKPSANARVVGPPIDSM